MREAEEAAFARGVKVEALMDQAGAGVARAVQEFFPYAGTCIVYAGKGHNGGDALGANELLREPIRAAAKEINRLRHQKHLFVFAVDLPTGLNGDSGEIDPEDCVIADFTITIGFAKHGLIVDTALDFVGRLEVVSL